MTKTAFQLNLKKPPEDAAVKLTIAGILIFPWWKHSSRVLNFASSASTERAGRSLTTTAQTMFAMSI